MEYFDCFCCLENVAIVFHQLACTDERHKMCTICYQKLPSKALCPICKQDNPHYVNIDLGDSEQNSSENADDDDDDDGDSSEYDEGHLITWVNIQLSRLAIDGIQQRLVELFQESENQNVGNNNAWQ